MACGVEFLGRLENRFCAERTPGIVAGEQGLEFADDLLGGGFEDQVALDPQLEAFIESPGHGRTHSPEKL